MRKLFVLFIGLIVGLSAICQQVNKNFVLVEIFTSTGCYYCPGAELGAIDLIENGQDVAVIAYHHNSFGDTLYNAAGLSRINFYGYEGTPDVYFNGGNNMVGGDHSNSLYSYYLPRYNSAISVMSSFTCDVNLSSTNDLDFTANVNIDKVYDYAGSNLKLFLAVTESNMLYSWEGQSHLNFLERGMYPSGSGINLDFSSTSSINEEVNFTIDPSWNLSNCELIVFVQDMTTKEVLQVTKADMELPAGVNNVILQNITAPNSNEVICETEITPSIIFKNKGTVDLNSVDFEVYVNDELLDTYNWTGTLPFGENLSLTLNTISYNQITENQLKVIAVNPNGVSDDFPENNIDSLTFIKSDETTNRLFLELYTANWGFEISYSLFNSAGNELYSSGALGSNQVVSDTFLVSLENCYYFKLYDTYGNGFNSNDGFCIITDNKQTELVNITGNFGYEHVYSFNPTTVANIFDVPSNKITIYPNPVKDILNIDFKDVSNYNITVFDVNGKVVNNFSTINSNNAKIDAQNLNSGVYYVLIQSDNFTVSEKIIIE